MSGLVLMENAGRGCAEKLLDLGVAGPVVICCGKGNNAGDGLVMARHLDIHQIPVRVLAWCDPQQLPGDAASNYQVLAKTAVPMETFDSDSDPAELKRRLWEADWIVDALLGTGARGAPRPPLDRVIEHLNAHPAKKMAIDIPSGLDCDTGRPAAYTFQADHTCTFVGPKLGFFAASSDYYVGQVHVIGIGVPRQVIEQVLLTTRPSAEKN
jgi:NAD(P)H-hydrate epimerase